MPEKHAGKDSSTLRQVFVVADEEAGQRLDRFLAAHLPEMSRTRLQGLVKDGRVHVDGIARKRAHRIGAGQTIALEIPPVTLPEALPEAIPLEILYSDEDVAVVNKPAGIIVHPGAGAAGGTVVNALLRCFGRLSTVGGASRPGIVHRLDKGTSGVLVVARNDAAHKDLAEQFQRRCVEKTYLALVHGRMRADSGRIELPVARDLRRRTRMTARRREGRPARTEWRVVLRLDGLTLIEAGLLTGRTHQLRVHFSAMGHPVVGDTTYGAPRQVRAGETLLPPVNRSFLHAARVRFLHPRAKTPVEVRAPLSAELAAYLRGLADALGIDARRIDAAVCGYL